MEKCRRMKRWKSLRIRQQCYRLESFAKITDIHKCGPVVKNHVSQKMVFGYLAIRRTSFRSRSQGYRRLVLRQARLEQHLQHHHRRQVQAQHLFQHQLNVRVQTRKKGETHLPTQPKSQNQIKNKDHDKKRWNPYFSELPEWLQEFRGHLVDERVPKHRDSHASSFHEPSLEPQRRVVLDNHCFCTHFPKDRNCEIRQRTKIKRAPCRRCTCEVVLRAENFGDFITSDHEIHG